MSAQMQYLKQALACMLLLSGPLLHEGIQQQPPHMDDSEACISTGLLNRGPPLAPALHLFLQRLHINCTRWQAG